MCGHVYRRVYGRPHAHVSGCMHGRVHRHVYRTVSPIPVHTCVDTGNVSRHVYKHVSRHVPRHSRDIPEPFCVGRSMAPTGLYRYTAAVVLPVLSFAYQIRSASLPLGCPACPGMFRVGGRSCPISRLRAYPVWNCRKHEPALWTPSSASTLSRPGVPGRFRPPIMCRDKGQHTVGPWCGLSALAAAWHKSGFVLFSAHCCVALEGTAEHGFMRAARRRSQPRTLPYTAG